MLSSTPGATHFGAMLYRNCVSGSRTVDPFTVKDIEGYTFQGYGSHIDEYPIPYLICSCAVGITTSDIDTFIIRLQKTFDRYRKMSVH